MNTAEQLALWEEEFDADIETALASTPEWCRVLWMRFTHAAQIDVTTSYYGYFYHNKVWRIYGWCIIEVTKSRRCPFRPWRVMWCGPEGRFFSAAYKYKHLANAIRKVMGAAGRQLHSAA